MTYTFPLALTDFFKGLPITTVNFDLPEALSMSQTGGGEILTADLGDRLWRADVVLRLGYYGEMEQIKAKLHMLRYAGRSLLVHQLPIRAPQADPQGLILGSSAVNLFEVRANNREIRLGGLPSLYQITTGDGLAFQYGSNPTRYAFHQVVRGVKAPGSGNSTDWIEVVPFIQPGFTTGAAVTLIDPSFKAVVVPGTFKPGTSGSLVTDGVSFSLLQTFR